MWAVFASRRFRTALGHLGVDLRDKASACKLRDPGMCCALTSVLRSFSRRVSSAASFLSNDSVGRRLLTIANAVELSVETSRGRSLARSHC